MSARALLAALADASRREIDASRAVLVVAHPDDETIALGGQLHRLRGLRLVMVTDGSPRNLSDAKKRGFADASGYGAARRTELRIALACGDLPETSLTEIGIPDQGAAHDLTGVADRLAPLLAGAEIVLTHAYEGGHPDHDATAFAVHRAAARATGAAKPAILEFPLYRMAPDGGMAKQSFAGDPGIALPVEGEALARKLAMRAAHATQRDMLVQFAPEREALRPAPAHRFDALPNGGALWYAQFQWGLDGPGWLRAVAGAGALAGATA
jgi:LmbE family N-acetylglucosaminyl deacetylase